MPDLYGPIQEVTISGTLWLLIAPPLLAALYAAFRALTVLRPRLPTQRASAPDPRTRQSVASLSIGAVALSFGVALYHAVLLGLRAPEQRFFLQHLWRLVRLGQLDASADLAFDPLTATMALVITGVGLPIFVFAAEYMKDDASFARFFAWLNGFIAAMLVLVLADNFLLLFFGWEGVGLCSWGLIGFWWHDAAKPRAGRKAFVVNRVGDAGFLLGVAFLYWGLGGTWADNEYAPDLGARFSSVEVRGAPEKHDVKREPASGAHDLPMPGGHDEGDDTSAAEALTGEGYVTLTEYSGAVVFMDDARAPLHQGGEPLRAPFVRFPVKGGIHSFRIHPGGGLD
ncbi:MAG TPA: proton-conducting transporter membrane subunit, partial [Polyangiaceae bacterium]